MKIKDIMSKDVQVVAPETLLHEVAKKMQINDCGSILVAKDDRLLGVHYACLVADAVKRSGNRNNNPHIFL
jgi:CBS domain-containing protein